MNGNNKVTLLCILTVLFCSCVQILDEPETSFVKSLQNSGKTRKAVLLQSFGNATVDLSLQVSILSSNYKLLGTEVGNTFIVDTNHGMADLDSSSVNLKWISNDTLQIEYDKKLRTYKKESTVAGVHVFYVNK
jgi:hypothetical protein